MTLELQALLVFQLILAVFLGLVIGMDREARQQPAGLRTHMLVSLGACLFTQLSVYAFPGGDPTRMAAQIVVGIGFLGAGTIVVQGNKPHHLTTAASIWATAAVGTAVGVGAWFLALAASVLIWIILALVRRLARGNAPPSL
jgi:putative Mg2+ transporter-C (MgtC) family protein